MEDTFNMDIILYCKYCNEPEDKQNKAGLTCGSCSSLVHLTCLRHCGTPGDFPCDVFFKFVCEECSINKRESFVRYKFPWVNVIYLAMYHLSTQSYGISRRGYFHFKTHVCSFIDRHWQTLFGSSKSALSSWGPRTLFEVIFGMQPGSYTLVMSDGPFVDKHALQSRLLVILKTLSKQKKNWVGTIAGVLSVYNKILFKSGSVTLGEAGWWKLLHNFSPAVAAHIVQEMAKDKPRNRQRNQPALDRNHFIAKIAEMGYKNYLNNEANERSQESEQNPCKKRRMNSGDSAGSSFYAVDENIKSEYMTAVTYDDSLQLIPSELQYSDLSQIEEQHPYDTGAKLPNHLQSDPSSLYQHYYYDSDSRSGSDQTEKKTDLKIKKQEEKPFVRQQSLFSTELNSENLPWEVEGDTKLKPKDKLEELTQYEEIQLLKQVESLIPKVKDPSKKAYLCRFRAKLTLRRLKRHKHLPMFDLDKTVKLLGGYVTEDPRVVTNADRVLDRFQRSYLMDNLCGTISAPSSGTVLLSSIEPSPFRSAYSGATLKPYIRRDLDSVPTWLRLTDELLRRTNRHIKDYTPPPRATIDYSYVRPQHIAAVNQLTAQFFWPGIDLTEALQYPEFSCVVSYKRVVVGCAFLVPDAGRHEAYISFVLTRPEWRRAGIATFMLYHLLQTCTGKDVTLHVSPTNPAIFLYQKFGFKVEELVQDFYEKYYDMEYKGCRHALFLRLVR